MAYIIRTADVSDLSALTELYLAYSAELQQYGLQYEINVEEVPAVLNTRIKSRLFFVGAVLLAEKVEGFIICSIAKIGREYLCEGSGQVGYVNDVYVSPSMRCTGCANALLDAAKAWLKECGLNSLELEVLSGNTGGKSFWERIGGHEIATFYQIKF
jgi:ribosomal protein S18 acetylase RimI-like enzyme